MDDLLTVRFRVANVFKNSFVSVYLNDERIMHMRKRIMSPGEMEQVILQKKKLQEKEDLKTITIRRSTANAAQRIADLVPEKNTARAQTVQKAALRNGLSICAGFGS